MKARRVVRARRPPAVAAPAPAGANPFAAINLFQPPAAAAPVQTSTAPPAASTAVKVRMIKQQMSEGHKRENMLTVAVLQDVPAEPADPPESHAAPVNGVPEPKPASLQPAKSTDSTKAIMTTLPTEAAPTAEAEPPDATAGTAAAAAAIAAATTPAGATATSQAQPTSTAAAPQAPTESLPAQSTAQSQPTPSTSGLPVFGGFASLGNPGGGFSSLSGGQSWCSDHTFSLACCSMHGHKQHRTLDLAVQPAPAVSIYLLSVWQA